MPTGKMKGNTPDDFQQALWAPFMYFVPGIAGTCIAISNKLGSWTLPINYACKGVCDMIFTVITQHLSCLIDDEDQRNSPRYFEGLKCRMVARTILIKTHQCLSHGQGLEDAQVKAVQSLNVDGMHLCLTVPLCHQLVQRLVKIGPLLCLSTIMPYLRLPVVSLRSVLQLLDGQRISDPKDYTMVRDFVSRALDSGSFLPFRETPDGRSVPERNITPYLGSFLQNRDSSSSDDSQTSELRRTFPTPNDRPASLEALRQIGVAVFRRNSDVLKQCCFVQDESSFVTLLGGVRDAVYDLRGLFGGMSCYENSRQLVSVATGRTADGMPTCFENNHSRAADPMFVIRQTTCNKNEYALGVRVWDALLFAALIRRPRRDYGIVYDFSLSITEFIVSAFPTSVFPFQHVPTLRLDPLSGDQMLARVGTSSSSQEGPRSDRPEQILRFKDAKTAGRNAIFSCSSPGPTGLLEVSSSPPALPAHGDAP